MPHLIEIANAQLDADANLAGYAAYDAAGEKLGTVDGVIADRETLELRYLVVDAGGWLSQKRYVVPMGELDAVYDDERTVAFRTLRKGDLGSGAYPHYDERWLEGEDHADFQAHERDLGRFYRPADSGGQAAPVDYASGLYQRPRAGAERLQLLEERLRVDTERYQAGTVRVGTRVTERTETAQVPVREERVVIERHPVEGERRAAGGAIGEEQTIEVPLTRERVDVRTETVVAEEVTVRTEAVEHREQVEGTVRTEELVVEDPAGLVVGEQPAHPPAGASGEQHSRHGQ
jgi:uncharacterized protein (TIGR02271 family)